MAIKLIDLSTTPGLVILVCPSCGTERRVNLDRGAIATKPGPFALAVGDTLELALDGGAPATVTFASGDFPDFSSVTAPQLAARLGAALAGAHVTVESSIHGEAVVVESALTGASSRVDATGGSARAALGFPMDGQVDPFAGRPVLGVSTGGLKNKDAIGFRRCACGANELVLRTWDGAPTGLHGVALFEQRGAVNALAQHFKAQGWVHPDVRTEVDAETGAPPDIAPGLPAVVLTPALPGPPAPQRGGP